MTHTIGPVCPEDMTEVVSAIFRAHRGENHWLNKAYPGNLTAEGQKKALDKLQGLTATFEIARWVKATDIATGEIVGAAIWGIFQTRKPNKSAPEEGEDISDREEYVRALNASIRKTDAPFWEGNTLPLASLFGLAVPPEHQFKGIGTMLMTEGLKEIDKLGAKTSVFATKAAQGLYEKCGFKLVNDVVLEVPEKFSAEEKVRMLFMVRDRNAA